MQVTPQLLLNAYCQGIFPMADPRDETKLLWYDPDPRTIMPLEQFHLSRSLRRTLRKDIFDVRKDIQFRRVMELCAEPAPGREETWISEQIIDLYTALHHHGYAHSVETYQEGRLVGGIYGISVNGLFAGESMFSRVTDASKVALAHLVAHLKKQGFTLFDVQFMTEHLRRFGAQEISRQAYKKRLGLALEQHVSW